MSGRVIRKTVEGIPPEVVTPVEERIDTDTLLSAIETEHEVPVAMLYAKALTDETIDWPRVNRAIMARWSKTKLIGIKRLAWSMRALPATEPAQTEEEPNEAEVDTPSA